MVAAGDFHQGMAHALAQGLVRGAGRFPGQAVDGRRLLAHVLAQAVGVDDDDKGQGHGHAKGGMADAFAQGDQGRHAGDDGAMVAGKAAIADQAERPLPRADTVDQEFDRSDQDPGDQGRDEVSDIHGVFLLNRCRVCVWGCGSQTGAPQLSQIIRASRTVYRQSIKTPPAAAII